MPTEAGTAVQRRTLRLALGTSLALIASQWLPVWKLPDIAYMMAMLTMILLLFPIPAPGLKGGIVFVLAVTLPCFLANITLLPLFEVARWSGILMVLLALLLSFHYAARGGSPVLSLFVTLALALVVSLGSVRAEIMVAVTQDLLTASIGAVLFVWLAHAMLPEPQTFSPSRPPAPAPAAPRQAWYAATRALIIILPVTLFCLFSANSVAYVAVMMKTASMGQQASTDHSRAMARSLLASTLWGGILAVAGWLLLSIWPSLLLYTLFVALVMLRIGLRNFQDEGLAPNAGMWLYALITMFAILAPSVLDMASGRAATESFVSRLGLFIGIALYGVAAVTVFDAFLAPRRKPLERPV